VVENSKNIFDYLGIEEEELKNISNENGDNINTDDIYVAFGLALIFSYYKVDNSKTANKGLNIQTMQKGDVGNCLMEATGLNALVAQEMQLMHYMVEKLLLVWQWMQQQLLLLEKLHFQQQKKLY
jgi:hypothetical protein